MAPSPPGGKVGPLMSIYLLPIMNLSYAGKNVFGEEEKLYKGVCFVHSTCVFQYQASHKYSSLGLERTWNTLFLLSVPCPVWLIAFTSESLLLSVSESQPVNHFTSPETTSWNVVCSCDYLVVVMNKSLVSVLKFVFLLCECLSFGAPIIATCLACMTCCISFPFVSVKFGKVKESRNEGTFIKHD